MNTLTLEQFDALIAKAAIKPKLRHGLKFVASTVNVEDWSEYELLAIKDRTGVKGVLLLQPDSELVVLPYELSRIIDRKTGRGKPVICDFCKTWQAGSNAASITFPKDTRSFNSVSFLCCADLACSSHVRNKTAAATSSRAQLREDLTAEQRIDRLRESLRKVIMQVDERRV